MAAQFRKAGHGAHPTAQDPQPTVSTTEAATLLDARTRELADARAQQQATSEILRLVSEAPSDLEKIFATIL